MLFSSWLRNWKRSAPAATRRTQTSPRQRASFRPRLEAIEDRCLMSTAIVQTNLVSDDTQFTPAQVQDPNLVNPWGLAASPTGEWWVANEGTGTSTLYNTSTSPVTTVSLVVGVPPGSTASAHGYADRYRLQPQRPGFDVSENGKTGSSVFLFATADGTISGWSPSVDSHQCHRRGDQPRRDLPRPGHRHGSPRRNAAVRGRFRQGHHRCLRSELPVGNDPARQLHRPRIAGRLPPFNIQAINNRLYVEYAPVDDVLAGTAAPGEGAVDVFNADGQLQERLIRPDDTHINQPWAVAMAPSNFGSFSNDLLVGNFGDGTINAFDPKNGHFVGELKNAERPADRHHAPVGAGVRQWRRCRPQEHAVLHGRPDLALGPQRRPVPRPVWLPASGAGAET